ncbi:penicillin-binding protein 2 [Nocardioides aurantiacus]|uniref:Penicillin-binding protein 2 n=1 Tax=Nocardioides aurantiacus TaxID=86796 RepID=A0A3N2CVZ7_9ACTN|nr:penicillin-binding protein 2 [Nocardioides aurantiacus]ROR91659.1 penicillin-binding protein 2 [Nocardioides aurantiacus]
MAAVLIRPNASEKSRLRLFVVQALVVSLFLTLFVRLWYMQVATGEGYQAAAAEQSVRDVVVQPARGLIVDDVGRPLVANRSSWVVSVDRTLLGKLPEDIRERTLDRLAGVVKVERATIDARMVVCGQSGAEAGSCWNGSPYQPVPVARDVPQQVAVKLLERTEEFPAVLAQQESVRAYPNPFGVNGAHVLGYLSPITGGELEEAEKESDTSVNGASVVGRAGVEKAYDRYLRGTPGYKKVAVDSMGRVLGDSGEVESTPGATLVTSIDAEVQGYVEKQLAQTIQTARGTTDTVTGRRYAADSGAAVVLDAKTGRVVAMASQPTYDPEVWSGGITSKQLERLYSEEAGTPLLSRATQGQFAPGSTWKPMMTAAALSNGYSPETVLACGSGFQVGNRTFKNYESGAYGNITFAKALEVSCNTFFYKIGFDYWQELGSDETDVEAKDPLVSMAKTFGFGKPTGIDLPGEASGRIADRKWKLAYWESMKDYYCKIGKQEGSDFQHRFAREFCVEGSHYRAGDAVNFAIGQGDTVVTPLQLARAYAALSNGGTLYEPRVAKAIVSPDGDLIKELPPVVDKKLPVKQAVLDYIDGALKNVASVGTMAWRLEGFPLDEVTIRAKTGSAEVYGKQSTSWVASYTEDYVVVMMVSQGGTGSGTSGPAIRKIWEKLYGVKGTDVRPGQAAIAGTTPPAELPTFADDGSILPPATSRPKGD